MTDCRDDHINGNRTFESKVDIIDVNLESHTTLTKTLTFYDIVKTDADLTGVTFELVILYPTLVEAFRKPLTVTNNEVELTIDFADVSGLDGTEFIIEIYRTENAITKKISEGKLAIT
jgi:hypothetical protein